MSPWLLAVGIFVLLMVSLSVFLAVWIPTLKHDSEIQQRTEGNLVICLHATSLDRATRIVKKYRSTLEKPNVRLVMTVVPELITVPKRHVLRVYSRRILEVPNKGLDIGGWMRAVQYVEENMEDVQFIMKMHDKSDEGWLHRLCDPIFKSLSDAISIRNPIDISAAKGLVYPVNRDPGDNWYWPKKIQSKLEIDEQYVSHFIAGTMFLMRAECAYELVGQMTKLEKYMNTPTSFDPSWYHYYYTKIQPTPGVMEVSVSDTKQFKADVRDVYAKHGGFRNGLEATLLGCKKLHFRDAMFEHGVERMILPYFLQKHSKIKLF